MPRNSPIHVVCRSDGVWQVEREDGLVPLSLHARGKQAVDAAWDLAAREHRGLAIHRRRRPPRRPIDVATRALLLRGRGAAD